MGKVIVVAGVLIVLLMVLVPIFLHTVEFSHLPVSKAPTVTTTTFVPATLPASP